MNKKGEESSPIPILISIIVIVFLLVVVFLFLGGTGKNILIRLGIIIPTFNNTQPPNPQIEIIRYNLLGNDIEIYDGVHWYNFEGEIKIGDKTLIEGVVLRDFSDFYFERTLPSTFELEKRVNRKIKETGVAYQKEFTIVKFDNAQVYIETSYFDGGQIQKNFVLSNNNKLLENNQPFQYIDEPELEIIRKASEWRDSVLKKPAKIRYLDKQNNKIANEYFCAKQYDNKYLVVNLAEPEPQDFSCQT